MAKAKKEAQFIEYTYESENYTFTGRLYKGYQKTFGKVTSTPLSIKIDDLMSISGCALKQTDKNTWISFPEYQNKENDYVSYVYVDKDQSAFDELAGHLESLL